MSSRCPMRLGRPLKNQTWEQGLARSMCPRRSRGARGRGPLAAPLFQEALAADAGEGHFDAALVADDAPVLHAFVLSAQAFPILGGSEDARAEQPVALRLKSPVINSLRLGHFAVGPAPDFFRRSQRNTDG